MSHIAIIGGHGKVALRLTPLLVEAGHDVSSIIHNPDQRRGIAAAGATPVISDVAVLGTDEFVELLEGNDVVIWSAGAGGGHPERTYAVDRDAAIRSMDAALAAGVPRYIMVSYKGARLDHGVPAEDPFFAYAESKAVADEHLRNSTLAWTILAPSELTLDPGTGKIEVGAGHRSSSVSRDDVAAVAAAVVELPTTARQVIEFNNGAVPIAEALAAFAHV